MTAVLAFVMAAQGAGTAADYFPLRAGLRTIYEQKTDVTLTVIDEVGRTVTIGGKPAVAVIEKNRFNQPMGTTFYRVDGNGIYQVGQEEDRSHATPTVGQPVDLDKLAERSHAVLELAPPMPIFKFDGGPTEWRYGEIPKLDGRDLDPTTIKGTAKPAGVRTVLGKKVDTIEVHTEVELGEGNIAQRIVENAVYGRGIGLIEWTRRTTFGKKTTEVQRRLTGIEESGEGK